MSTSQLHDQSSNQLSGADTDLLFRLRIALNVQPRAGWHLVRVAAQNGVVQLSGLVPTFYDRQLITALVRHVAGVFGIEDKLEVGDSSIRQQVVDAEETVQLTKPPASFRPSRDAFRHLPALPHALDEIFAGAAAAVVPVT